MTLVISDTQIAGVLRVLNTAISGAQAYPSPLTQRLVHEAFDAYELVVLQAQLERREHAGDFAARAQERATGAFPSGARLQPDDDDDAA